MSDGTPTGRAVLDALGDARTGAALIEVIDAGLLALGGAIERADQLAIRTLALGLARAIAAREGSSIVALDAASDHVRSAAAASCRREAKR